MKIKKIYHDSSAPTLVHQGNAMIMLVVFMAVGLVITTATITLVMVNSLSASRYQVGQEVLSVAESGVENALLRLLRDPSYAGETLVVGEGQAEITVTGTGVKTITAVGSVGTIQRTIQVVADTTTGVLSINSWQEIY